MTLPALPQAWRQRLLAAADQPPAAPREPLVWRGLRLGSIEAALGAHPALAPHWQRAASGWEVPGDDLTTALAGIAFALRDAGLAHVWRDEQLAVRDAAGRMLGTVERAAVRVLGIATDAVHLTAWSATGGVWLQRRAFDKPTDPGLWDTLVGGMVPASDTVDEALARESWEEAGLRMDQLQELRFGGVLATRRPAAEVAHGWVEERLHWYVARLPATVTPANQDGEVAEFRAMDPAELATRLAKDEFTVDAALILLAAHGAPPTALPSRAP